MQCLECNKEVRHLDNQHLNQCSGLTLQEYAIRHHMSLDLLVDESIVDLADDVKSYSLPADEPSRRAQSVIAALLFAKAFRQDQEFTILDSEIRRLDQLLWCLRELLTFGFQFRQEYSYSDTSHRVVANNCIKTLNNLCA